MQISTQEVGVGAGAPSRILITDYQLDVLVERAQKQQHQGLKEDTATASTTSRCLFNLNSRQLFWSLQRWLMYFSASALLQCVSFHLQYSSFENALLWTGECMLHTVFVLTCSFQIEALNCKMPSLGELGVLALLGGVVGLWGLWAGRGQVISLSVNKN